ncbi:MAG: cytochrome c biogenesis protein ResB [Streptosporangiales bacterium]|nr:cytochrome c biogenesis protein ResB [Streptosporangiales bacterium]
MNEGEREEPVADEKQSESTSAVATQSPADQTGAVEPGADLGTTPAEPVASRPRGSGLVATARWAWRQLTSMRTALVLLFLLALAAIPGSLLPQRGVSEGQVAQYFTEHPKLAPVLDKLYGFDVFAAPWFAAIYLLLFISLIGCIVPRTRAHLKQMRARPPRAPRNFDRLPHSERIEAKLAERHAVEKAARVLRSHRFRVDVDADNGSVAGEKGYLRETGNLLFHVALLVVLFAVALGGLFGYRGNVMVTEGDGFANTVIAYDSMQKGRLFSDERLSPFTVTLDKFSASYVARGPDRGTAERFDAYLRYREEPGAARERYHLKVNDPLPVGGSKVYLLGHGYSPQITVRDGNGKVVHSAAVPFVSQNDQTFLSQGVVKAPSADPQLGFQMFFLPTFAMSKQGPTSAFPAPLDPALLVVAWEGDLGLDKGASQSVFTLDTSRMKQVRLPQNSQLLRPGDTVKLPGDRGTVRFDGLKEYAALQVNHDPGKGLALGSAVVAMGALLLSLFVRRRRVWVRAGTDDEGRTVVEFGGLSRSDGVGGFTTEFTELADELRTELKAKNRAERPGATEEK